MWPSGLALRVMHARARSGTRDLELVCRIETRMSPSGLLVLVGASLTAALTPGAYNIQGTTTRRAVLLAAPLAVVSFQQTAGAVDDPGRCQATLTKRCLDSQGRSEGIFGENGLLSPAINAVSVDKPGGQSPGEETSQQKMARIRKERMAAEAKAQSDEYRRLQAGVGTNSFGSTVSVQVP